MNERYMTLNCTIGVETQLVFVETLCRREFRFPKPKIYSYKALNMHNVYFSNVEAERFRCFIDYHDAIRILYEYKISTRRRYSSGGNTAYEPKIS